MKDVVIEVDEELWAKAKSQAALDKLSLKDWIDAAIKEKLAAVKAA